jgi:hypothetical protein
MPRSKAEIAFERAFENAAPMKYRSLSNEDIKKLAQKLYRREIFPNTSIPEHQRKNLEPVVFLPLAFMSAETKGALYKNPPGMIYGRMEEAGSQGVQGYPIFRSCAFLSVEDAQRVREKHNQICKAMECI